MEQLQRTEFEIKDTPLLSLSAIGSPAAFSTAVKQHGSTTTRAVNNGDSPFTNLGALQREPSPQHKEVNGRLSLSSTLSDKGGVQSLNNTCPSVGILDLDAMQDSSMHRFLTSPFDSQDLHLHMSSTMSVPSTQALGATPAIGGVNELEYPTNVVSQTTTTTAAEQAPLGLPQELLMQQPGPGSEYSTSGEDTETPDLFASRASHTSSPPPTDSDSEFSDDDDDNQLAIAEAIKGALDELELTSSSIYTEEGPEYGDETNSQPPPPPHTTSTATPGATSQQNGATASQFSAGPVVKESGLLHSGIPTAASIPLSSSPIVNGRGDTSLKLDLSLGAGGEREGEGVVGGGGDETLIGDETEPSVMKEADEFSQFDPSHLSSLLERESFNATSPKSLPSLQNSSTVETKSTTSSSLPVERRESEVDDKEVSPSKTEDLMVEGKSEEGDVSSRTESALSYSASEGGSPAHTMEGLPSALLAPTSSADDQSTIETSALLASLTTPSPPHIQPVNPLLPSTPPHSSSLMKSLGSAPFSAGGFGVPGEEGGAKNLSGVYNPFDSDDNGSVENFGQLEFGDHSADSFMAQLAKDEEEIKATHLTPSSEQFQSFSSVIGSSHFSISLGDSLSMDAYFQKKSGKMGQLSASKLPPSERPRFSDTAGHVIESPDINQSTPTTSSGHMTSIVPPTMRPPLEPIPEGDALDSTLLSENADKSQSPPTLASSSSSQTGSASDDLTPLITAHSPFPAKFDVPKLDFANASATTQHTISPISGQHQSTGISSSLRNSSPLLQKFNKSSPVPLTGDASSVGLPPELLKPAAVGDDSTTSTLLLKEMSALTLSSPPFVLDPSLISMPTPSIAKLPSFDITEMTQTQHLASFSSLPQDVTSSDLGLDHSLLHSLTSPGKSNILPEHAQSTTSPAKLLAGVKSSTTNATMASQGLSSENPLSLAGVASSTASRVSKGHSSPSRCVKNPLSAAKSSPTKITFSPKRPPSPGKFQVTQVLSTETLTTWSSNSPLTSPPPPHGLISPPPLSIDRNSSAKNASTPNKKSGAGAELSSGAHSPKTEAAREKLASLQAQLDAARFHADEFLANLKSCDDDSPPAGSGKPTLTSKSSPPVKIGRAPTSSSNTSTSPKLKASPPASSHSGAKKSKSSTSPLSRPSKPFMSMPAHSSAPKKRVAVLETSIISPGKEKRESGQTAKLNKASTGHGGVSSDQLSSKRSPSKRRTPGTPTKREVDQVHKASAKDGSSPSKVVKSSHIQAAVSSARHVHIQEPQSGLSLKSSGVKRSLMMCSSGESPPLKSSTVKKSSVMSSGAATSSTADTLSSTKFTLSSLLTSHAHTSPPPLSSLTTSASPSPSPQGHSPPKTSPPTTSSHPVISTRLSPASTASQSSSQPPLITKPLTKGPTPHTTTKLATATVDPSILKVPDSLCLSQACCVGVSVSDQLMIANLGERWLQMEFRLIHLYRDGTECSLSENVFSFPQRSFVGPEQQENIKVTFSPRTGGSYEAVVAVFAHLVVSSSSAGTDQPVASIVVKATAEEPQLEIQTSSLSGSDDGRAISRPTVLDYGVMVGGSTSTLQLRLANRGHAPLPLCLSITAKSALSQLYFSFGEVPQSLVSALHPSLLGSSHLLHPHHHTLTLTLPPSPQPDKEHSDPEWYTINVCFHAPKKFINDSISDPGPPEEISAQLVLSINGLTSTPEQGSSSIASIPMRAIVGLARLHVPRTMQSVSLSCAAGRATSRELPFRNAGNIPLRVRLKVSSDHPELFSVSPDFLLIEPRQESQVNVYFSSSSSLVCEGALLIHIEPNGPNYELKLRGEATPTTTTTIATPTAAELKTTPTESAVVTSTATAVVGEGERSEYTRPGEEVGREDEGILSCNRRVLFWGGVELGKSVYQEVVLHNSYSVAVPLSISIRHPDSSFKLKSVGEDEDTSQGLSQQMLEGSRKVELLPGMQLPVGVVYTPTLATVSLSALDITDLLHSKKYRLRLSGYGGRGSIEVVSGQRVSGPGGECWVDLGGITRGKRITAKISVYNSGLREAFVTAMCYPDKESSSPLPVEHVSVTPSKIIVPPQQIKDLLLVYHTNERDESHCRSSSALLACIKLTTGDEIMRQRWQKVVTRRLVSSLAASQHRDGDRDGEAKEREKGRGASSRLKNASNKAFLAHFPEQEAVVSEPDFSSFELEDEEDVFEEHLTTLIVSLSGSPPTTTTTKNKAGSSTAFTVSPPPHSATARLKHKLSLSNTPPVHVAVANKPSSSSSSLAQGLTQSILTAHTLVLPDAQIGHYSEKHLDIHNPYLSDLEWELSYNASPFVRKVRDTDDGGGGGSNSRGKRPSSQERGGGGGEIFKANYSVFWVSERRGVTPPQSTSKVPILFQPHDAGSFSQIWELRVSCDELGTKKLRISFGGRAVANQSTESQPEEFKSGDHQPKSHERTEQIAKWLSQTQRHLPVPEPSAVVSSTTSATPLLRKAVYIKDERVVFPLTEVGSKSTVKVRVCNRGPQRYLFDVIKPVPPFSVDHHNFELGSRQCARLPIHFSPTARGEYAGVLAIRTNAGHQTFTELRGKSLS